MKFIIKINILYSLFTILLLKLIFNNYIWKPIISDNKLLIYLFKIIVIFNHKIFIICIYILNIMILYYFSNLYNFNIINILIFNTLKILISESLNILLRKKNKTLRPCIIYIKEIFNINKNDILIFLKLKNNILYNKIFNNVLNIDSKYNLINNYYSLLSGHTLLLLNICDIYFLIFNKINKYNLLLLFLIIINTFIIYSRLILGMHFYIDILLSIFLNFVLFIIILLIFKKLNLIL